LTATECISHKWLANQNKTKQYVTLSTDKLKKFIIRRKWQVRNQSAHDVICRFEVVKYFANFVEIGSSLLMTSNIKIIDLDCEILALKQCVLSAFGMIDLVAMIFF